MLLSGEDNSVTQRNVNVCRFIGIRKKSTSLKIEVGITSTSLSMLVLQEHCLVSSDHAEQ